MRVSNMMSNTGRPIANQFIVYSRCTVCGDDATYFQSYNTTIARKEIDNIILQTGYWDNYSATTNKYLNQFLGTSGIAEIRAKVKSGEYEVGDI